MKEAPVQQEQEVPMEEAPAQQQEEVPTPVEETPDEEAPTSVEETPYEKSPNIQQTTSVPAISSQDSVKVETAQMRKRARQIAIMTSSLVIVLGAMLVLGIWHQTTHRRLRSMEGASNDPLVEE